MGDRRFGYYSAMAEYTLADSVLAAYVQVGPNGERVMAWFSSPEVADVEYKWPDKVLVGEFDTSTFTTHRLNDWPDVDDDLYDEEER